MKKDITVFLFLFSLLAFSSCISKSTLNGKVADIKYEGKEVYLCNPYSYNLLDSTTVEDGSFSFHLTDSIPTVYILMLKTSADDKLPMTLPVVGGDGNVKVRLGESVITSGTSLNDSMQDFLLAMDAFYENATQSSSASEDLLPAFQKFLEEQILRNKSNIVGVYIYQSYKSSFPPELKEEILGQVGDWFNKQIKE